MKSYDDFKIRMSYYEILIFKKTLNLKNFKSNYKICEIMRMNKIYKLRFYPRHFRSKKLN